MPEKNPGFTLIDCNYERPVWLPEAPKLAYNIPPDQKVEFFTITCPIIKQPITIIAEVASGKVISLTCDYTDCDFHAQHTT